MAAERSYLHLEIISPLEMNGLVNEKWLGRCGKGKDGSTPSGNRESQGKCDIIGDDAGLFVTGVGIAGLRGRLPDNCGY